MSLLNQCFSKVRWCDEWLDFPEGTEFLYRVEETRWSLGVDEWDNPFPGYRLELSGRMYPIVKRTKCGAWISVSSFGAERRFVRLSANKRFAVESKEAALKSFVARKKRQLEILGAQVAQTQRAMDMAMAALEAEQAVCSAPVAG